MWFSIITAEQRDDKTLLSRVSAEKDSLWFDGHFPDAPILAGIAQLDMVTKSIQLGLKTDSSLKSLGRIKFKKIIRPGDVLDIRAVPAKTEHHYSFTICNKQQEVCSGKMVLTPKKEQ